MSPPLPKVIVFDPAQYGLVSKRGDSRRPVSARQQGPADAACEDAEANSSIRQILSRLQSIDELGKAERMVHWSCYMSVLLLAESALDGQARRKAQLAKLEALGAKAQDAPRTPFKILKSMRMKASERERARKELERQTGMATKYGSIRPGHRSNRRKKRSGASAA